MDFVKNSYDTSSQIYAHFKLKNYTQELRLEICLKIRIICCEILQILIAYLN